MEFDLLFMDSKVLEQTPFANDQIRDLRNLFKHIPCP